MNTDLKYFIGKIVIEDFIPGGERKSSEEGLKKLDKEYLKAQIKAEQNLAIRKPRDPKVWEKFLSDQRDLKLAKVQYKMRMNAEYPGWTNKSAFYTQKALIWS